MSCDNWENGSVKIPTAEWGKTKRLFREQFNHAQELAFLKANMIYDRLMKETKGKRGQSCGIEHTCCAVGTTATEN